MHRAANAFRQRGQNPWPGFNQGDVHVFRLDAVQAICGQFMCRVMQFGGQLDTGRAGADDGHTDLLDHIGLPGMGAQIMVKQLLMKTLGLLAGIQKQAMLSRALGPEVVGGAAHRNHQRVVAQLAGGHQFLTIFVESCRQ